MNRKKLTRMLTCALLMALIVLLGVTPIGFINFGVIYITFLCIPVVIGAMTLGLGSGLILGFCMGCVSLYTGLRAPSALVAPILQKHIVYVVLMCFAPRMLVPLVSCAVQRAMDKRGKKRLATALGAAAGSLTNTALYLGMMLAFYRLLGIENAALLTTLGVIVLTAGLPEAAVAALISTPVIGALEKAGLLRNMRPDAPASPENIR